MDPNHKPLPPLKAWHLAVCLLSAATLAAILWWAHQRGLSREKPGGMPHLGSFERGQ